MDFWISLIVCNFQKIPTSSMSSSRGVHGSVYIEFLELIKNRVSAKIVLKEAVYYEALLYPGLYRSCSNCDAWQ